MYMWVEDYSVHVHVLLCVFCFSGAFNLAQALSNRPSKSAKEKLSEARLEQKQLSEVSTIIDIKYYATSCVVFTIYGTITI